MKFEWWACTRDTSSLWLFFSQNRTTKSTSCDVHGRFALLSQAKKHSDKTVASASSVAICRWWGRQSARSCDEHAMNIWSPHYCHRCRKASQTSLHVRTTRIEEHTKPFWGGGGTAFVFSWQQPIVSRSCRLAKYNAAAVTSRDS